MKKEWWKEAVVYQVYPRSFYDSNGDGIGDIRGIIEKLDYLKELGIDVIWLNPVFKSPNTDNGYDISDYCEIMDEFGTKEDFDKLLKEAHNRKIKIIMDLVVNHTSDGHKWFIESRSSIDNPYRDYYIWRKGKDNGPPNNWVSAFSGSAWKYDKDTDEYYLHLFAEKQPDLNWENENMRDDVYKMMIWWLDKGIDGFRMDVINYISKDPELPEDMLPLGNQRRIGSRYYANGPRVHEFLQEMNRKVLSKFDVMTVGETPKVDPETAGLYVNDDRHELDMLFHFELMDLGREPGKKFNQAEWKLKDLKDIMWKWYEDLKDKGWNSLYLNNHDQPRMVSRFGDDKEYRLESAKMLATLLHTWVGTPYIYQGEEIGMTNVAFGSIEDYNDIETLNYYIEGLTRGEEPNLLLEKIHRVSRDNARTPMQWNSKPNAGFTTGRPWLKINPNYIDINVENALKDENSIFYYYKKLIGLRKAYEAIVYGHCEVINYDNESVFSYTRTLGKIKLLVILNFFKKEVDFILPEDLSCNNFKPLLSNYEIKESSLSRFHLRPYEAILYELNEK